MCVCVGGGGGGGGGWGGGGWGGVGGGGGWGGGGGGDGGGGGGEVQKGKQTDRYVRRRERQNVTMGGQPAAPFEALRAEVLVVQVLGHLLQVLHVGAGDGEGPLSINALDQHDNSPTNGHLSNASPHTHTHTHTDRDTHMSMVRSLRKSLCSGFSTSTTPQG